ncbi:16S rRNA processing protein RimM [Neisseria sicca]|uniref:16S rRNA processing protein RimM n=1 Tax=Neisseria sicca TaxID=490 RepID=A0A2I1XD09_NEISI|nr:16S rRNA processing protein RimM [Neisseria sicca]
MSDLGFAWQVRGRSPRYGRLNLIHCIGLFKNHKGRLKTVFQTTFVILGCSVGFTHEKRLI